MAAAAGMDGRRRPTPQRRRWPLGMVPPSTDPQGEVGEEGVQIWLVSHPNGGREGGGGRPKERVEGRRRSGSMSGSGRDIPGLGEKGGRKAQTIGKGGNEGETTRLVGCGKEKERAMQGEGLLVVLW